MHNNVKDWLEKHLEEWVRPKLGLIPNIQPTMWFIQQWTKTDVLALQAVWREGKKLAGDRKILLAGRDVWLLRVLAEIEGFETIFRPDISSYTKGYVKEDYKECYLLDTGFSGSVPKALKIPNFGLVKFSPPAYYGWVSLRDHQVFPRALRQEALYGPWPDFRVKLDRSGNCIYPPPVPAVKGRNGFVMELASKMEASPKYWNQGTIVGTGTIRSKNKIDQRIADTSTFSEAAQVTIHIVKNLKPSLLSQRG